MYKIVRNRITEELEIEDNGTTLHLDVDISADEILKRYNQAQYAIAKANEAVKNAATDDEIGKAMEQLGVAVLTLFEVIFGENQTEQIVDFYQNRTLEMLGDIAPFISDVIAPKVLEAQKRITQTYKGIRK